MAKSRELLPHEPEEERGEDTESGVGTEAEAGLPHVRDVDEGRVDSSPSPPVCAFGQVRRPGLRGYHCIECMKWGLKMARDFRHGVEMGWWDEEGYTPADRRKQQKARV